MLGLVFKCVHGSAHSELCSLFTLRQQTSHLHSTRFQTARHSQQVDEHGECMRLDVCRFSLLGYARVWNLLPPRVVEQPSLREFQSALTMHSRTLLKAGRSQWATCFSPRSETHVVAFHI